MTFRIQHFHTLRKGRKWTKKTRDPFTKTTGFDADLEFKDRIVGTVAIEVVKKHPGTGLPLVFALGIVEASKKDVITRQGGRLRAEGRLNKFLKLISTEDIQRVIEGGFLDDPAGVNGKTSFNRGETPRVLHGMPCNHARLMLVEDFDKMVEASKFFKKNLIKFDW